MKSVQQAIDKMLKGHPLYDPALSSKVSEYVKVFPVYYYKICLSGNIYKYDQALQREVFARLCAEIEKPYIFENKIYGRYMVTEGRNVCLYFMDIDKMGAYELLDRYEFSLDEINVDIGQDFVKSIKVYYAYPKSYGTIISNNEGDDEQERSDPWYSVRHTKFFNKNFGNYLETKNHYRARKDLVRYGIAVGYIVKDMYGSYVLKNEEPGYRT